MNRNFRAACLALLAVGLIGPGCAPAPLVPVTVAPAPAPAAVPEPTATAVEVVKAPAVTLEKLKFDAVLARIAANKQAKYTMVDAWATWCGPCKENFPHVVAMNEKYAGKGLAVVSLSFDDPTNAKQLADAEAFLKEKKAAFTNIVLDEEEGVGFEKLNINAIPAVFVFGPDGKELKRFTMDDPNKQFTYDEVENEIAALLAGKPPE